MIEVTKYQSEDGKLFDSPDECQNYENKNIHVIDNRLNAVFDTDTIYYITCGGSIQRVKFVSVEETSEFDERYIDDVWCKVRIIESLYHFISMDDPDQEFNCWCEFKLPTKNLRSLFNFDILSELTKFS
jgi:hypothetical protein